MWALEVVLLYSFLLSCQIQLSDQFHVQLINLSGKYPSTYWVSGRVGPIFSVDVSHCCAQSVTILTELLVLSHLWICVVSHDLR